VLVFSKNDVEHIFSLIKYYVLTTIQMIFENREIKKIKSYVSGGIHTRNPWVLRLRNTCTIGCAKKTADNIFKK